MLLHGVHRGRRAGVQVVLGMVVVMEVRRREVRKVVVMVVVVTCCRRRRTAILVENMHLKYQHGPKYDIERLGG
ncbi:hypothetical protein HGM15179_012977 [Zosterops borbonicus]|uniref:Uncharacterized protein n=1 Tax=Zosterops borbonicus TaxID=364589 RepID=A0A8K1G9G4_9PASS|nr:hypothetical protein HGM15179_012977 [Zosterops borbonicus]